MSEFDKFEAVSTGWIVSADFRRRRIVRKRTHFLLQGNFISTMQSVIQNARNVLAFFMSTDEIMHRS
jgi:hypothetical protein